MSVWIISFAVVWAIILNSNVVNLATINESFGPVELHTKIGKLPDKYQDLDVNDQIASKKLTILVRMLVPAFPIGYGPIPPLDPYTKDNFQPIDINNLYFLRSKLFLSNLVVTGAQNVSLDDIEIRMRNSRVDVNFTVPQLRAEIDFQLQTTFGVSDLVRYDQPVFSGHLSLTLSHVSVWAAGGCIKRQVSDIRQVFYQNSAEVVVNAQNVQLYVSKLHIGTNQRDHNQKNPITEIIEYFKSIVMTSILKGAMQEVNKALQNISVDEVISFLLL